MAPSQSCSNTSTSTLTTRHRDTPTSRLRAEPAQPPVPSSSEKLSWGRSSFRRSWLRATMVAMPGPLAVIASAAFYITLDRYEGSLTQFIRAATQEGFWHLIFTHGPQPDFKSLLAVVGWVALQAVLYVWLPGPVNTGQLTPAGHLLSYRTNGLLAWAVSHVLLAALCWFGYLDPGFIPRNWGGLVAAMNIMGFVATTFVYIKAYLWPSHPEDRRFSGSAFYDFYMGIELNPRIGDMFDFKLFSNGRPGIIAWTLIDLSNLAYQYQNQGRVEPSLVLVTILQTIYVVDFFFNESWYLRTIDIAHDHYGFYLAWGCFCYLPTVYTIQGQYLGLYPTSPSVAAQALFFGIGLAGYAIFRSVNDQKDRVRRTGGQCLVWGKPAEVITAAYTTTDGKQHTSLLLCSGWWGLSRHANYVGDLLISFASCALAGTSKVLVWYYAIWMTLLLVHRCLRDEQRCSVKYGAAWTEYRRRVPWRFVPGVW